MSLRRSSFVIPMQIFPHVIFKKFTKTIIPTHSQLSDFTLWKSYRVIRILSVSPSQAW